MSSGGAKTAGAPFIELRSIRKAFGECVALADASLSVHRGTIHAIVGENGAGKSTAMKVLYGQYRPDEGEIFVGGVRRRWHSPRDSIAAGFGMVHQHFMLAGCHNAVENVLVAAGGGPLLPFAEAQARLEKLMKEFHMEVRLDLPVDDLSVGEQQRVEILKLLYRDSDILILDEPTAVLAPGEIEALFATLRGMAARGKTILIITHKLKEVLALADEVTVFRAGRVTGARAISPATSVQELAQLMVGREVSFTANEARPDARLDTVLELESAVPVPALARLGEISFRLRAGEILGIAGVEGNGQTELIRMLLHPDELLEDGFYRLLGQDVSEFSGGKLRAAGLAVFPEDRLREALLLPDTLEQNFLLGHQRAPSFRRAGVFLDRPAIRAAVETAIQRYDVRPANPRAIAGSLSGGNQQKLVVARELNGNPRFLLAAQPTRGVDIGAIEAIHARILALRNAGSGVLLLSSELDEVLKLSDRVLVLYRGEVVGAFPRGEFDEKKIGLLMAAGKGGAA